MGVLDVFRDGYVPNVEGALVSYPKWRDANPGELTKWKTYRDAILAGQSPAAPTMASKFGKALVAAGTLGKSRRTIFRDKYLPNAQGATVSFAEWKVRYPAEYKAWVSYRDALLAGGLPEPPTPQSKFGKQLEAAGHMAERTDMNVTLSTSGGTQYLTGTVTVTAALSPASQASTVTRVEFFVNDVLQVTDTSSPYSFSWDTTLVSDGPYQLKAQAFYPRNKKAERRLDVTVLNYVTPPPPPPVQAIPVNSALPIIQGADPALGFPTNTAVLDDFNRANGDIGANWTAIFTNKGVVASNQLNPDPGREAVWNAATFLDTEVYADIPAVGLETAGLVARRTGQTFYVGRVTTTGGVAQFFRYVSGVPTQVGSNIATSFTAGDTLGFTVTGAGSTVTLTLHRKSGGAWSQIATVADVDTARIVTAGHIGYAHSDALPTTWRYDNFGGGAIVGTQEGTTLTVTTGDWTNSPTSYRYQWLRCNSSGASCVPIPSATTSSYTLAAADVGSTIRCAVTALNAQGASAAAETAQTSVVTALAPSVPVLITGGEPIILGTPKQGNTLSVSNGNWTNSPTSYSRQWQRCNSSGGACVSIAGATGATYVLVAADVGSTISCLTTASNSSGSSAPAQSPVTAVVASLSTPPPSTTEQPFPRTYIINSLVDVADLWKYDWVVGFAWMNPQIYHQRNPAGIAMTYVRLDVPAYNQSKFNPNGNTDGFAWTCSNIGYCFQSTSNTMFPGKQELYTVENWGGGVDNITDGQAGSAGTIRAWNIATDTLQEEACVPGVERTITFNLANAWDVVGQLMLYAAKIDKVYGNGWDGVWSDNAFDRISTPWTNGLVHVCSYLRSKLPGKSVGGNGAWMCWYRTSFLGTDPQGFLKMANANLVEGFENLCWGSVNQQNVDSFIQWNNTWRNYPDPYGMPRYNAFWDYNAGIGGQSYSIQRQRWGLTLAMMASMHFGPAQPAAWYDEFWGGALNQRGYLGQPTANAVKLGNGVWRRDFQNGIAINNSTGQTQTVSLGANFRRLTGTQDPSVNNGATVSSVTIPHLDGLILLR